MNIRFQKDNFFTVLEGISGYISKSTYVKLLSDLKLAIQQHSLSTAIPLIEIAPQPNRIANAMIFEMRGLIESIIVNSTNSEEQIKASLIDQIDINLRYIECNCGNVDAEAIIEQPANRAEFGILWMVFEKSVHLNDNLFGRRASHIDGLRQRQHQQGKSDMWFYKQLYRNPNVYFSDFQAEKFKDMFYYVDKWIQFAMQLSEISQDRIEEIIQRREQTNKPASYSFRETYEILSSPERELYEKAYPDICRWLLLVRNDALTLSAEQLNRIDDIFVEYAIDIECCNFYNLATIICDDAKLGLTLAQKHVVNNAYSISQVNKRQRAEEDDVIVNEEDDAIVDKEENAMEVLSQLSSERTTPAREPSEESLVASDDVPAMAAMLDQQYAELVEDQAKQKTRLMKSMRIYQELLEKIKSLFNADEQKYSIKEIVSSQSAVIPFDEQEKSKDEKIAELVNAVSRLVETNAEYERLIKLMREDRETYVSGLERDCERLTRLLSRPAAYSARLFQQPVAVAASADLASISDADVDVVRI